MNNLLLYSHDGTVIGKDRDNPNIPEPGQEITLINPEGVSHWVTLNVTSEHIDTEQPFTLHTIQLANA